MDFGHDVHLASQIVNRDIHYWNGTKPRLATTIELSDERAFYWESEALWSVVFQLSRHIPSGLPG